MPLNAYSLRFDDFKTGRNLSGFGSLLLALGSLLILPAPMFGVFTLLLGIILLLFGVKRISKYYSEIGIFNNILRGFGFWIASLIVAILALSLFEPLGILVFFVLLFLITVIHYEARRIGYLQFSYVVNTLNEYVDYILTIFFATLLMPTFYLAFGLKWSASIITFILPILITAALCIFSLFLLKNPLHKLLFFMGALTIAMILCFMMASFSPNFKIIFIILAIVASLTLPLLGALSFNDAFTLLKAKTGKISFQIAGWLLVIGVIESSMINVVGVLMVMPIAWIITSIAFLKLKMLK